MGQKKKPVHIFISNLFNIRFRIITSSMFIFSKWSLPSSFSNWSCVWISHPLYVCHVTAVWLKIQVCWQVTLIGWTNSSQSLQGSDCVYLLVHGLPELISFIIYDTTPQLAVGIVVDLWRDFWIRETGMGQQVAQLHERYMMMIIIIIYDMNFLKHYVWLHINYLHT